MPCEYELIGCARSDVRPNKSANLRVLSALSSSETPKMSAIRLIYLIPDRNSYRSGLSGIYAIFPYIA